LLEAEQRLSTAGVTLRASIDELVAAQQYKIVVGVQAR